jgi:hypothetical protein
LGHYRSPPAPTRESATSSDSRGLGHVESAEPVERFLHDLAVGAHHVGQEADQQRLEPDDLEDRHEHQRLNVPVRWPCVNSQMNRIPG